MTTFEDELAKTRRDIEELELLVRRHRLDPEKRVRLAYRQFHLASLTGAESDFAAVTQTVAGVIEDFGPKEDICLLKASVDNQFHRLADVKKDLAMCPSLAERFVGRSLLADLDFQEGRYQQAHEQLQSLVEENRTWDTLARLAHWTAKLGTAEEADRLYAEAEDQLSAKEMRAFAWLELQRGDINRSRGRYDQARGHYERASAAFPGYWLADEHMAGLVAAEGDFGKALAILQTVVARTPKPELRQIMGELLALLGRAEEAQAWFSEAVAAYLASVHNGDVHYLHHLADFYADAGEQPAEAVKWAWQDVALRPNFSTQSTLAWALYQNGDIAEGLNWIRLALSSGIRDGSIFATASFLFRAAGDPVTADQYARAATEINPKGQDFHIHH
jgi:tetratricopeptide (TPR) repeat protein